MEMGGMSHSQHNQAHGGGYVPQGQWQGQKQGQSGSGDLHGGGYIPGQHQQNHSGASNQNPQGQGQGNWQVRKNHSV
jgi:hypothetical protein